MIYSLLKRKQMLGKKLLLILLLFLLHYPIESNGYSVLTHEAIIDASWKVAIEPLLLKKYPASTSEQLLEAHSYAYGGSIIPDIGYYPFGSKVFTNLVHNIRSGDFTVALIEEARDLNEYAFALGALAHYMADNYGHSIATNVSVPLLYPKIKEQFGPVVTYADHKKSHSRVEFAFDVMQTARENYASKAYHDFIGFNVSRKVIERAFFRTYGLDLNDIFGSMTVAIGAFRWSVKSLLPTIVKAAWVNKRSDIKKIDPKATSRSFSYRMKNRTYYHEFGRDHEKAGIVPTIVSFLLPIMPKLGPLSKTKFKQLNPETEQLFVKSFEASLSHYSVALNTLHSQRLTLANRTLDTGKETTPGEYFIADQNYDAYLLKLKDEKFEHMTSHLKSHLISFYGKPKAAPVNKKCLKRYQEISEALSLLQNASVKDAGKGL
ncbi:zinc dependent phospholipase C family protein [Pedobacter sp. P351]|uniref:zinc dependent phospholipase C family protein n=1 Tax=Pedobacter superstes TaxID=3133441 RepID=UPI0030A262DC